MNEVDARSLLLTRPENVQYVTGFNVVGNPPKVTWALIVEDKDVAYLLVPPLEYYEALDDVKSADIVQLPQSRKVIETLIAFLKSVKTPLPLYVDSLYQVDLINAIKHEYDMQVVKTLEHEIEGLRAKKDEYEIMCISEAIRKAKKGLDRAYEVLSEGIKETTLAAEIEKAVREEDVEAMAFDIIVASGPRSSYPHARPSLRQIKKGESVIVDLGVRVCGYCSDLTRTFIVGHNLEVREVLNCVVEAQREAIVHVRSGVKASSIDERARTFLRDKMLSEYFLHGLGHGVGLSIHERPTLSSLSEDILEEGNIITVEPGVYIKGRFGVRYEDMVLVTNNGWVKLS